MLRKLTLHKVRVECLDFSPSEKYLISLGGPDDNNVVCWDLSKGVAICGTVASKDSSGLTTCVGYFSKDDYKFVTGGHQVLRVWQMDPISKKLQATDCQMGQIKRVIKSVKVDQDDEFVYCGTTTGDLLQVSVKSHLFKQYGPPKREVVCILIQ